MKTKSFALLLVLGCAGVAPLSFSQVPSQSVIPDGYVMRNGQTFLVRNGQASPLNQEIYMRITPAGEITGFDGQKRQLADSIMLTVDGRILPVPPGTTFPLATSAPAVQDRFADQRSRISGDSGENLSGLAPGTGEGPSVSSSGQSSSSGNPVNTLPGSEVPLSREGNQGGTTGFPNMIFGNGVSPVTTPVVVDPSNGVTTTGTMQSNLNTGASLGSGTTTDGINTVTTPNVNSTNMGANSNINPNSGTSVSNGQQQGDTNQQNGSNMNQNQRNGSNNSDTVSGPQDRPNSTNATNSTGPEDRTNSSNARSGNPNATSGNPNATRGNPNASSGSSGNSNSNTGSGSNSNSTSGSSSRSGSGSSSSGGSSGGSSSGGSSSGGSSGGAGGAAQ